MPERTNPFPQLVYLIQVQLKDRPDTVVTESKMLVNRSNGKKARETDIVVECSPNGIPFILAFECTRRGKRSPGIEWVERMFAKHEHLSDKLVLVSNRPFAKDAVDYARQKGIETVELSEATKMDWPAQIDQYIKLVFATFDFTVQTFTAEYDCPVDAPRLTNEMIEVFDVNGGHAPIQAAVQLLVCNTENFCKPVTELWHAKPMEERRSEHTVIFQYVPPVDQPLTVTQGTLSYPLKKLVITVAAKIGQAALNVSHVGYRGVRVVHATGMMADGGLMGQTVQFVLTEQQGQQPKAALMLSCANGTDRSIVRTAELNGLGPVEMRKHL